jgi:hypothetical protein
VFCKHATPVLVETMDLKPELLLGHRRDEELTSQPVYARAPAPVVVFRFSTRWLLGSLCGFLSLLGWPAFVSDSLATASWSEFQ